MDATYMLLANRVDEFEKRVNSINRRARRLGQTEIVLTWTGVTGAKVVSAHINALGERIVVKRETIEVVVGGEAPVLAGWEILGSVDHREALPMIDTLPGRACPREQWERGPVCDHCSTIRRRNRTYILQSTEDGRIVQIGKSCLADFIGSSANDPHALAALWSEYAGLGRFAGKEEEEEPWAGKRDALLFSLVEVVRLAGMAIRACGWVSAAAAKESMQVATADVVRTLLAPPPTDERARKSIEALRAAVDEAETARTAELAAAAVRWMVGLEESENPYNHNLWALASVGLVSWRRIGLAASAWVAYHRVLEQQQAPAGGHLGTVGKREVFSGQVVSVRSFDNFYGVKHMVKIRCAGGAILVWWASSNPGWDAGDLVTFKATVAKHEVYRGENQTVVKRAVAI